MLRGPKSPCSPGDRYGRLTLIEPKPSCATGRTWLCRCDCETELVVSQNSLRRGNTKSCGCLHRESAARIGAMHKTHGQSQTREYGIWLGMIQRCCNPNEEHYERYKGLLCAAWINSFEGFIAHVGPCPSMVHTIDRIDNERGYEPGNVRWSTKAEQARNTRRNVRLAFRGEVLSMSEWAERLQLAVGTIWNRINKCKWTVERALSTPIQGGAKR